MWFLLLIDSLLFAHVAWAFPSNAFSLLLEPNILGTRSTHTSNPPQGKGALPVVPPPFDAVSQHVVTTGQHRFIPPRSGDQRGECPGLNALANHAYLPRNGVATVQQFIDAVETVYGMAVDLGGFLAIYGAVVDGPLTSFSIGGLPHTGILGSHNNYESDSSAYKSDLNQYGTNTEFVMTQFKQLYDMQPHAASANYNLEVFRQYRKERFQQSVSENPYFVYGPFSGIEVSQAGYLFQYRLMSNKSAEYPEGVLTKEVLKSFMAVSGPENNVTSESQITGTSGMTLLNIPFLTVSGPTFVSNQSADVLYFAEVAPEILTVGCNQGQVNSYKALDVAALSGNAYSTGTLQQNPICFSTQFAIADLAGLTGLSSIVLDPIISLLANATAGMNCQAIEEINTTALALCPGFTLYGGPTGPIAPGATQA